MNPNNHLEEVLRMQTDPNHINNINVISETVDEYDGRDYGDENIVSEEYLPSCDLSSMNVLEKIDFIRKNLYKSDESTLDAIIKNHFDLC